MSSFDTQATVSSEPSTSQPTAPIISPPHSNPTGDASLLSFGDYELIEELGRGGMGVVFKARQVSLNRLVAVKMILAGQFASRDTVLRFRAEAEVAANLRHPNIVAIYETGEHAGQHFFSMDYVAGRNLAEIVRDGPLPAIRAARYTLLIAQAIHFAHQQGTLHRDLKPSNVLIDASDQPHITDFGLAKRLRGDFGLTVTGQVLGSPNFMPPEQTGATQSKAGPHSDVYGIGAILYHLLTGRPPFQAETVEAVLIQLRETDPVAPRLLNASVPRDLEIICVKCLEKEPSRRYASAQDLADEFQRYLDHEPILARPIGSAARLVRWSRRKPALASSLFLILILILVLLIGSPLALYQINQARKLAESQRTRAEAEALRARQNLYASDMLLTEKALAENTLARAMDLLEAHRPTHDGSSRRQEALTSQSAIDQHSPYHISDDLRGWEWHYFWNQARSQERFILGYHTNGATTVGLLPDGKTVWSGGWDKKIKLWSLETRQPLGELEHENGIWAGAHSPDGRWLATVTTRPGHQAATNLVRLWDLSTRRMVDIVGRPFWAQEVMAISSDGQLLVFQGFYDGNHVIDLSTREEIALLPAFWGKQLALGVAFAPDAPLLAYCEGRSGRIILWNTGGRTNVATLEGHTAAVNVLAFSADGRMLASGGGDRTLRIWDMTRRQPARVMPDQPNFIYYLAFSPDGRSLAVGSSDLSIRFFDPTTGTLVRTLRGHRDELSGLTFTPDSRTLISSSLDGTLRVWDTAPASPTKTLQRLPQDVFITDTRGPALRLSPDGRYLITVSSNAVCSVWDTGTVGQRQQFVLPWTNTTAVAVAPGGKLAAFAVGAPEQASTRGLDHVLLWDLEANRTRCSGTVGTNFVSMLTFTPDASQLVITLGRELIFWNTSSGAEAGRRSTAYFTRSLGFSRDGRWLAGGTFNGWVQVWDLISGGRREFPGHDFHINSVVFSLDGRTLIASGPEIRLWDVETGRMITKLKPSTAGLQTCALSVDGRTIAVGDNEGTITLWNMETHHQVATLTGHNHRIEELAFTPDGQTLVSVSQDELRVWRATAPTDIRPPSDSIQ